MELIVWLPDVALSPDQVPVALQIEALLEDQVSSVEPLSATVLGAALRETVGAGGDPGGSALVTPPLSGPAPPPQAASPSTYSNTNNEL